MPDPISSETTAHGSAPPVSSAAANDTSAVADEVAASTDEAPVRYEGPGYGRAAPVSARPRAFQAMKVVDVHIDRPLELMSNLERYGSVNALVRLHGSPLGQVRLPIERGRCSPATQRRAILEQLGGEAVLHLLEDRLAAGVPPGEARSAFAISHPAPETNLPSVTVAICTRDHPESLARCLESIDRIDYRDLEVMVVDNAPSSEASLLMVRERWPHVRYVRELRPGLDWARNRALSEASGDIVAFTDDDCIVDERWVAAAAGVFAESETVAAVTGLVVPFELETWPQMLFELRGGFGRGFKRRWYSGTRQRHLHVGAGRFGTGANMAFRREILLQLGGFDPALDVGTVTNGGGDLEMFFRVLQEGHDLVYEPDAIVRHRHRRDYASLHAQMANNGLGLSSYIVRSLTAYPERRRNFLAFVKWWLFRWMLRDLLISVSRPGGFPRELLWAELKGAVIGLTRYPKAKREAVRIARTIPS
jgi:glycosyltransferase involved in cell wall biosynthesis